MPKIPQMVGSLPSMCGLFRLCGAVLSHTDAAFPLGSSQSNRKAGRQREGRQAHCNLKLEDPSLLGGGQQVTVCSREKEETNSNAGTQHSGDRGQQID